MFEGATAKLENARTALGRLRAVAGPPVITNIQIVHTPSRDLVDPVGTDDPMAFAEAFSSALTHVRAIGDAVLKDGSARHLPRFRVWREEKKDFCRHDELLKYIAERRNADVHNGFTALTFAMHAISFSSDAVGAPPSDDALLMIDGMGPYWVVGKDTPSERRLRCEVRSGYRVNVGLASPPSVHQGRPIPSRDPVTVCGLGMLFYESLVFEAKQRFGP